MSKLPDDKDPWAPINLLTPEQKKSMKPTNNNNVVCGLVCWNQDILSMEFLDTLLQMPKERFGLRR